MEKPIRPFLAILLVLLAMVISGGGTYWFLDDQSAKEEASLQSQINDLDSQLVNLKKSSTDSSTITPEQTLLTIAKNLSYILDGTKVTLVDGTAYTTPLQGGSKEDYFVKLDNSLTITGQLNDDTNLDLATILYSRAGGNGTFYYLSAILGGTKTSLIPIAIGSGQITIKTIAVSQKIITIAYEQTNAGATQTISKQYSVQDGILKEI